MNYRIFVEKYDRFEVETRSMEHELNVSLGLRLKELRLVNIYDLFGFTPELLEKCRYQVFGETVTDRVTDTLNLDGKKYVAIENLPGQFDQRASSAVDCVKLIEPEADVEIRSGRLLIFDDTITAEEIERVKKELRDFTDRINKGETTFSTLARLYSEDPGSARRGGEYGFTGRGVLTPEFANVVFNLTDPKKISKVFETEYGFHIAQLIEKRGDRVSYRHILLKPRVDEEDIEVELNRLDTLANDIRKGKVTFDEAATWVSQDKDTRNNHGLLANPQSSTSRFEMQELAGLISQDVAKVVENMQIGEISKPFRMMTNKGKEVCAIVKLKNRIDGHKATISEDYQRLKDIVTAKRGEEKLQKWIVDKQRNTYVRINPNWRRCDFKYPGWIKN